MKKSAWKLMATACFALCFILLYLWSTKSGAPAENRLQEKNGEEEQIVLHFLHYQGEAEEAYNKVFDAYEKLHPEVRIESEFLNTENYDRVLAARIAICEEMDIVGTHPGAKQVVPLAQAGYLEDLSGADCLSGISEGSLQSAAVGDGIYGVPTDLSYICVFYNQEIFERYGLAVPETWTEFLQTCAAIKKEGMVPLSLGYRDIWIQQMIPYALAPTTIYRDHPDFDSAMYRGEKQFQGEEWQGTLEKMESLMELGYVTPDYLKTSYDQQISMFAQGDAAMMVMGSWGVALVKNLNPGMRFGLFVMPASDDGVNWISSSVGGMLSVSADSKNKVEALEFLDFLLENDEIYAMFLEETGNLSARMNFSYNCDPLLQELTQDIQGSYSFLDVNWPVGMGDAFIKGVEEIAMGKEIPEVCAYLDLQWQEKCGD